MVIFVNIFFDLVPRLMLTHKLHLILEQNYGKFADEFAKIAPFSIDGGVIAGSGMKNILQGCEELARIPFSTLPGFPQPAVSGHGAEIRILKIYGQNIAVFCGRSHLYEGWTIQESLASVGILYLLGAKIVIITNSAGGLHPEMKTGDIMLISDILNLSFRSARRGWFFEISKKLLQTTDYFDAEFRSEISRNLTQSGIFHVQGIYSGVLGPSYETAAEIRMFRLFGADAIGMSTVHEAEFAHFCGMKIAGCSLISNVLRESSPAKLSHDEVLAAANTGITKIEAFIQAGFLANQK